MAERIRTGNISDEDYRADYPDAIVDGDVAFNVARGTKKDEELITNLKNAVNEVMVGGEDFSDPVEIDEFTGLTVVREKSDTPSLGPEYISVGTAVQKAKNARRTADRKAAFIVDNHEVLKQLDNLSKGKKL